MPKSLVRVINSINDRKGIKLIMETLMMTVNFTDPGPKAQAVMSYSQSSNLNLLMKIISHVNSGSVIFA